MTSYAEQTAIPRPFYGNVEQAVADLPHEAQVRMAALVLAGWRIGPRSIFTIESRWAAWRPDGSLGYGAATLLWLLQSIPESEQ